MTRRSRSSLPEAVLAVLATAGCLLGCADPPAGSSGSPAAPPPLPRSEIAAFSLAPEPGGRVQRRLARGETHVYEIRLSRDEYLLVGVEQKGVDLAVSVTGPSGGKVVEVDSPTGDRGVEPVPLVAAASGTYRIRLQPLEGSPGGDYELTLAERRPATRRDRWHAEAAVLAAEADRLRAQSPETDAGTIADLYRRAAGLRHRAGAAREEAVALRRLGNLYGGLQRTGEAQKVFDEAAALFRRAGDRQQEAGVLTSMGRIHQRLFQPEEARRRYEQAIDVARAGRFGFEEAMAWNNLATLHQSRGELEKALAAYDRALMGWRRQGLRDLEATVLHNLGSIYLELGHIPEAKDCLLEALDLQRKLGMPSDQISSLTVLGQVFAWEGDPRSAVVYYRRAMALAQRTGNRLAQGILLDKLGSAHLDLGDADRALAAHERAAEIFQELKERERYAWVLANLGWLHERQGRPGKGLRLYQRSLVLLSALGNRAGEAFALAGEARIARARGDLETAREKMVQALDRLESLRKDAPGPVLRSSFLAPRRLYFEEYVDLLMELHLRQPGRGWDALALEASERTRARSFLETLSEARFGLREHAARELLRRERELLDRLDALERERLSGSSRPGLEKEQRDILLERETLLARIRDDRGEAPPRPLPLTVPEIRRRILDPGSTLLIYALGDKRSFLWLMDSGSLRSFVLPGRGRIDPLARAAHDLLNQGEGSSLQAELVLARLTDEILKPAAPYLADRRLLIVADGGLRYIPFAALPMPGAREPLVVRHEIVHLDSPSVLAMQRERLAGRPPAPLEVAVVADPVFNVEDPRLRGAAAGAGPVLVADLRRSADDLGLKGFRRLPESGREAAALLALAPEGKSLGATGFAATRRMVLQGTLSRYRIVHIATHGLIHPTHPELSGLVLSLVDEHGKPQDGFLRSYELQEMNLPADLVVLSACQTALGKEVPGEGLVGLTRGLMRAGARGLVVSLWSVEDASTAELMSRFYGFMLRQGMSPAAALRKAQLSMVRDPRWNDPRHWAPFIFQGDWR